MAVRGVARRGNRPSARGSHAGSKTAELPDWGSSKKVLAPPCERLTSFRTSRGSPSRLLVCTFFGLVVGGAQHYVPVVASGAWLESFLPESDNRAKLRPRAKAVNARAALAIPVASPAGELRAVLGTAFPDAD